jgi:hypothetical protein
MSKKYLALIMPLIALIAIGILSGNAFSLGHFKDQSGIGGTIYDCNKCHDFVNGIYGGGDPYGTPTPPPIPPTGYNLRWVKTTFEFCSTSTNIACDIDADCPTGETCVSGPTVKFTKFSEALPADGTLGDGNPSLVDGACEVCHTATTYHNKYGTGVNHYPGNNCTICHPHFTDEGVNYFAPTFVGGQSHFTHFNDPKGPMLGSNNCTYCHSSSDFHFFADGRPLVPEPGYPQGTTVCNSCHSPSGAYDGVNDSVIGAKPNWETAIYKAPDNPADWPSEIQDGKEAWCAGCHDDVPANSKKDGSGINAPNVMGDDVNYGYNVTGHGIYGNPPVTCAGPLPFGCHATISKFCSINLSKVCIDDTDCPTGQTCNYASHIDNNTRTYSASLNNYRSGYRLAEDMAIPRWGQYGPLAFKLCFRCHDSTPYLTETSAATDFRDDTVTDPLGVRPWNFHWEHLKQDYSTRGGWDSDWNWPVGATCNEPPLQCSDSSISCTACHNVHGSPCVVGTSIVACTDPVKNPMIRHGELISSPGNDRVPAFQFHWYDQVGNPVTDWNSSRKGGLRCGEPYVIKYNNVCWGCHARGERQYYRAPGGPDGVIVLSVQATDYSDTVPVPDEFGKGDDIRYHVNFKIKGPNPSYCVQATGTVKDFNGKKRQSFKNSEVLTSGSGIQNWTWDKKVPSKAATGLATVTINVKMYNSSPCPPVSGTTPIYTGKQSDTFGITP